MTRANHSSQPDGIWGSVAAFQICLVLAVVWHFLQQQFTSWLTCTLSAQLQGHKAPFAKCSQLPAFLCIPPQRKNGEIFWEGAAGSVTSYLNLCYLGSYSQHIDFPSTLRSSFKKEVAAWLKGLQVADRFYLLAPSGSASVFELGPWSFSSLQTTPKHGGHMRAWLFLPSVGLL